jgi:hypothetical protein
MMDDVELHAIQVTISRRMRWVGYIWAKNA